MSLSGDTAIVGAYGDDDFSSDTGSAYVFIRDEGGNWTEQAKLRAGDATTRDFFGGSVAISGDTAVVGASVDDDGGTNSGSAYVFVRDGSGNWAPQTKLLPDDPSPFEQFGRSVSLSGETAVIGARFDGDDGETNSGSAYVFVQDESGVWTRQAKLRADDATAGDQFGFSVYVSGSMAFIGAPFSDEGGSNSGSAYVFVRDETGRWAQQTRLLASDAGAGDQFWVFGSRSRRDRLRRRGIR